MTMLPPENQDRSIPGWSLLRLQRRRPGFTLGEMVLVLAVIGILLSLLLPALHTARNAARIVQCRNNLMQLGIAMHNYEMALGVFPPGTVNHEGPVRNQPDGYHVSWAVQLLPMMDQAPLYSQVHTSSGAYDADNRALAATLLPVFRCPEGRVSMSNGVWASSYAACTGGSDQPITSSNDGMFYLNSSTGSEQIRDGATNTIMIGERLPNSVPNGAELGWTSGTASTLRNTGIPINSLSGTAEFGEAGDGTGGFGGLHDNGALFLMADGSVQSLDRSIDPGIFSYLGNRSDGARRGSLPYTGDAGF